MSLLVFSSSLLNAAIFLLEILSEENIEHIVIHVVVAAFIKAGNDVGVQQEFTHFHAIAEGQVAKPRLVFNSALDAAIFSLARSAVEWNIL